MGRRPKEIDQKQFENLCGLQCTYDEICSWFDVTDKTLNSWCKRTYGKNFSEVFREKRGRGKISLRRTQWELAKKNASMAIFLGKQYLGQTDQGEVIKANDDIEEDALSKSLRELAERLDDDV
jgi:hypothetical protein